MGWSHTASASLDAEGFSQWLCALHAHLALAQIQLDQDEQKKRRCTGEQRVSNAARSCTKGGGKAHVLEAASTSVKVLCGQLT